MRSIGWLALLFACKGGGKDDGTAITDQGLTSTTEAPCGAACDEVPATTRFARLTHTQWENSVVELLSLDGPTGLSDSFIGDPLSEGLENDADALQVSPELWQDYQRAAETLAAMVVADPDLYSEIVPQDPRTDSGGSPYLERVEAESAAATATTGGSSGSAWNLWSRGELHATFELPVSGDYTLRARVWADQAGPDLASAVLGIDGVDALTTDVSASVQGAAEVLEVQVTASAGSHQAHVGFLNDFYDSTTGDDRNLYVDWIEVEGGGTALGTSTAGDAERDAWIAAFGRRAHRRPLTAPELAAYTALFDQGPELVGTGDDFADGVRLVVGAMLQSPYFLYRVEESTASLPDGRIPLSSHEIAARLSFALWNSMPDAELDAAADAGALTDVDALREQARRLLDDPRARAVVADLHRQVLHLDNYVNIYKDGGLYPEFGPTTPASMRAEVDAFVQDVIWGDGSVHGLYTSPRTFVNEDLAAIYGIPGISGDQLVPVDLDPSQRAGLLTLSGFLALEADPYVTSPIRRGVFVNLQVLCVDLPPPPDNVPPLPPSDGQLTTRELVDLHTGDGTCGAGCHSTLINPPGFAFENYDALGRWRTTEYGMPVDATGSFRFSDGEKSWGDAVEMSAILADSVETHRCYAEHWLEHLHGRHVAAEDDAPLDRLAAVSLSDDLPILDLVLELVIADSFRFRAPEVP